MTCSLSTPATAALPGEIASPATAPNVPQVQHEIASRIAGSLHSGIREVEKHAILGAPPRDLDVYELTLRGIARKHQFSGEATRAGRADLEEALRRDPNYAPAHAYLAWLNLIDILMGLTGEWGPSRLGEVIFQFNRAIELDLQSVIGPSGAEPGLDPRRRSWASGCRRTPRRRAWSERCRCPPVPRGRRSSSSGEIAEALELADKAVGLNPLRPSYYCFFHAMILWGNERYQQALDEEEECLRKAPAFGGAHTYRVMCLVGLGRLDEARKLLAQLMASPAGFWCSQPKPPELASRALAQLQAAGWRPTIAAERAAG